MAVIDIKVTSTPPFPSTPFTQEDLLVWAQEFQITMEQWAKDVVESIKDVANEI